MSDSNDDREVTRVRLKGKALSNVL